MHRAHIACSPLASITAVEVDEEAGAITMLLSAPPSTFLGRQGQGAEQVGGHGDGSLVLLTLPRHWGGSTKIQYLFLGC